GGQSAQKGCQRLIRGGYEMELGGCTSFSVQPGDRVIIETPGGGGYGY
ncbi:MAG: hydantoinase B/oxoprolinase family protein, partial [Prosthecobacter sp.]